MTVQGGQCSPKWAAGFVNLETLGSEVMTPWYYGADLAPIATLEKIYDPVPSSVEWVLALG